MPPPRRPGHGVITVLPLLLHLARPRAAGEMAASSRRLAARLRGLGSLSSSKDAAALNSLQPWRSLFRWARDEMPAEPTVPPRPAQRTCGDQQWMDEYRWAAASGCGSCGRLPPAAGGARRCLRSRALDTYTSPACLLCRCSWLEGGGAEVQRVLRQEARYADGWLRRIAALAERLHEQMLELVPEEQVRCWVHSKHAGSARHAWEVFQLRLDPAATRLWLHGSAAATPLLGAPVLLLGPPCQRSARTSLSRHPSLPHSPTHRSPPPSGWAATSTGCSSCQTRRTRATCGGRRGSWGRRQRWCLI